ncbi:A disintegrin and metalloproteinase with thrombospondin motifs 18 [Elysia marginata]|uniref:A disintegrin and metalloproteinase with thrombospondin motifs 18 n=1 Tax=Elysia marginata TaxID=1093978 RepID=A0AAV4IIX0_9GAST|nr:A disintegrin and metalloproteinase with thrombospondin motifs 18 [Elysia marginata]
MSNLALCFLASLAVLVFVSEARSVGQKNVLELVVAVDKPVKKQWKKLAKSNNRFEQELYSTIVEVNEVFKTLADYGLDFEIRVKKVLTPRRNILGRDSSGQIESEDAYDRTIKWLNKQKVTYDHAVVFLGADLLWKGELISGYSGTNTTCSKHFPSVSLVQAMYDYGTATTIVKLISQTMGVVDDGKGVASSCSPDDGYILTAYDYMQDSKNKWSFSSCSAEQIKSYIKSKDCLLPDDTTAQPLSGYRRFGQVVGAEETCRRTTGKSVVSGYEDEICTLLYCLDQETDTVTYMVNVEPPPGVECDQGKICIRGSCVPEA